MYLFHPQSPPRIGRMLPDARIVILLRNPTERAISHYRHSCKRGRENLPIVDALEAEEDRIGSALRRGDFSAASVRYFSYKSRGLYAQQIRRYLEFYSRERLLFLSSEKLFSAPSTELPDILDFLGVAPDFEFPDLSPHNVSSDKQMVPAAVYDYLNDWFEKPNADLYGLLDTDFGW